MKGFRLIEGRATATDDQGLAQDLLVTWHWESFLGILANTQDMLTIASGCRTEFAVSRQDHCEVEIEDVCANDGVMGTRRS